MDEMLGESDFSRRNWLRKSFLAVVRRPDLWLVSFVQVFSLIPANWWQKKPFLPVPDKHWIEFRMETAFGDPNNRPSPQDTISFLEWCKRG